ncbi:methyltransferase cognate corrinoid proteins [Sporobacter termitidis DSM 10068]|uniref:Methyltransferase cognate corrinoid proteins n=1 Tax=Sporobacter termitidis DSM 10068 TaxID=1123282 RepID=A0A1M5XG74_9FIRM|nr:corrinoid protein [Sporobacter termitidis]SHH98514.1 methyltransferase cognate corrinoid proteins [Sporobacter termitidis DSM 10068]
MSREAELHKALSDAVLEMEEDRAEEYSRLVVAEGYDAYQAIDRGLADGMDRAGQLFEEQEYFVPELILCSDAMYKGLDVLKPQLRTDGHARKPKAVIGVIEGDTHDIGKNLVKIMTEAGGFELVDLGRDVPPLDFVERAKAEDAELILISTLMTTTMNGMAEVIRILNEQGIRRRFKVMVGGGPVSAGFARKIGADGYSRNAAEAVRLAKTLLGLEPGEREAVGG